MNNLGTEKNLEHLINYNQHKAFTSWLEINQKALEHNIASYKSIVNPALLAVVVKSNAYGHGLEIISQICDQSLNVDVICLVSLSEAIYLRSIGIKKQLLVLSILDADLEKAIELDIAVVAYDIDVIRQLNNIGKILNKKARIHIKVDTGLSRLGFLKDDALFFIKYIKLLPFITVEGIFTHFADSENEDQSFCNYQIEQFNSLIKKLENLNINIQLKHTSCSAAITANINSHFNMARVGIGIYGLWPSIENRQLTNRQYPSFSLKPVMTWKTKVIQIKKIPAGSFVGYDRTYKVDSESLIATIPIGYWDGYDRELSNKGKVMINNQIASVVGRVAMNLTMLDVTGLNASVNDEVILLGNLPGITPDDIARFCNTINYEIVTRINPLLPRIFK